MGGCSSERTRCSVVRMAPAEPSSVSWSTRMASERPRAGWASIHCNWERALRRTGDVTAQILLIFQQGPDEYAYDLRVPERSKKGRPCPWRAKVTSRQCCRRPIILDFYGLIRGGANVSVSLRSARLLSVRIERYSSRFLCCPFFVRSFPQNCIRNFA